MIQHNQSPDSPGRLTGVGCGMHGGDQTPPGTVLDSYLLAEAVQEAALTPGVVNIFTGGRDIGAYLVSHPRIDKVAFWGVDRGGPPNRRSVWSDAAPGHLGVGR